MSSLRGRRIFVLAALVAGVGLAFATLAAEPTTSGPAAANTFNRLLKKPAVPPNASPMEDGIHDPTNPGTALLQPPAEAFF